MPDRVYIETTFVSYLTGWPSRDLVIAGHQQITHEWWSTRRASYELCVAEPVLEEASLGDPQAAQDRLDKLSTMTLLETTAEALSLAAALVAAGALPENAAHDALHVAVSAVNRIPFGGEKMINDPIVDEVRKIRDALAARFNYDWDAIYRHIKEQEKEWEKKLGRKFVSYASGPVEPPAPPPTAPAVPASADTTLPAGSPATEH